MKPIIGPLSHHRLLLEPGLPPMMQTASASQDWLCLLKLPALAELGRELPQYPAYPHDLAPWAEPDDVLIYILTNQPLPSGMQRMNLAWLEHEQATLRDQLRQALRQHYPKLQQEYDYLDAEALPPLPTSATAADATLGAMIRLNCITLHTVHSSTPYLGFDFACTWDDEHGLGLLSYGHEVLSIGTGDVSQDGYLAQEHRERFIAALPQN